MSLPVCGICGQQLGLTPQSRCQHAPLKSAPVLVADVTNDFELEMLLLETESEDLEQVDFAELMEPSLPCSPAVTELLAESSAAA